MSLKYHAEFTGENPVDLANIKQKKTFKTEETIDVTFTVSTQESLEYTLAVAGQFLRCAIAGGKEPIAECSKYIAMILLNENCEQENGLVLNEFNTIRIDMTDNQIRVSYKASFSGINQNSEYKIWMLIFSCILVSHFEGNEDLIADCMNQAMINELGNYF